MAPKQSRLHGSEENWQMRLRYRTHMLNDLGDQSFIPMDGHCTL